MLADRCTAKNVAAADTRTGTTCKECPISIILLGKILDFERECVKKRPEFWCGERVHFRAGHSRRVPLSKAASA